MPKTSKRYKKTGVCPVCNGTTQIRYARWRKGGSYDWYSIICLSPICQYAYSSHQCQGTEVIGFAVIGWDLNCGDEPGLPYTRERVEKLNDIRNRAIFETQNLLNDRDARIIMECFQSPNANKERLSERLFQWLTAHAADYPMNLQAVKSLKEKYARYRQDREKRKNDCDSNGNESDSPSSDS